MESATKSSQKSAKKVLKKVLNAKKKSAKKSAKSGSKSPHPSVYLVDGQHPGLHQKGHAVVDGFLPLQRSAGVHPEAQELRQSGCLAREQLQQRGEEIVLLGPTLHGLQDEVQHAVGVQIEATCAEKKVI